MPAGWDIVDSVLQAQLGDWLAARAGDADYQMCLYSNGYTPIPGSDITDYTECTFPGYVRQPFTMATFPFPTMTSHVAISQYPSALTFAAASSGFSTEDVQGYFVLDSLGVYQWGESFATVRKMHPSEDIDVTPILRHATIPA